MEKGNNMQEVVKMFSSLDLSVEQQQSLKALISQMQACDPAKRDLVLRCTAALLARPPKELAGILSILEAPLSSQRRAHLRIINWLLLKFAPDHYVASLALCLVRRFEQDEKSLAHLAS